MDAHLDSCVQSCGCTRRQGWGRAAGAGHGRDGGRSHELGLVCADAAAVFAWMCALEGGPGGKVISAGNGCCPGCAEMVTPEVVEALMRVLRELPSWPAVEKVEASTVALASTDAEEMRRLVEVMR